MPTINRDAVDRKNLTKYDEIYTNYDEIHRKTLHKKQKATKILKKMGNGVKQCEHDE